MLVKSETNTAQRKTAWYPLYACEPWQRELAASAIFVITYVLLAPSTPVLALNRPAVALLSAVPMVAPV
jgi:hypothetical protein